LSDRSAASRSEIRSPRPVRAAQPAPPSGELDPKRWWALWVVLAASFLALFDLFVVNVAAPTLQHGLHTTTAAVQLVIAGYSFTYAIGLITGGRLGDLVGPRTLFMVGMATFTVSLLVCGVAPNALILIIARLGQGAGASLMVPQVLALIQVLFPSDERPRAFAYFGATAGLGSVAGQVLGGVLVSANPWGLSWRSIFLVQLPIGLAGLIAGRLLLPEPPRRTTGADASAARRFDSVGALLFGMGLAGLLIPLTLGRQTGWPIWSYACLAAVVPLFAIFAAQQRLRVRRERLPLIMPRLFKDRAFTLGLLINVAFYAELSSFFLIITWFLQNGLGLSPLAAGVTFSSLGVGFIVGSFFIARRLAGKYAYRLLLGGIILVFVTLAAGTVLVASKGLGTTPGEVAPVMLLVGLGNGLVLPTTLNVVLADVAKDLAGAASGVLVTMQQVGAAVGVAGIGALFFSALGGAGHAYKTAMGLSLSADAALTLITGILIAMLSLRANHGSGQGRGAEKAAPAAAKR
jgi:EmrB/QacA subfamily drug resistance transporter